MARRVIPLVCLLVASCGRSDASLQAEVQAQLALDAGTAGADITATVTNGVAHITGEIEESSQRARAIEVAKAVTGITQVVADVHLSDAALARAVHSAIEKDPAVGHIPLSVEAHDGLVRLGSDQTNADERAQIIRIAQTVPGVTRVEDGMR